MTAPRIHPTAIIAPDADIAGDVEIVRLRTNASGQHRLAGRRERSGAMQDCGYVFELSRNVVWIAEIENARFEAELTRQRLNLLDAAAGKNRRERAIFRDVGRETAGVPVRAVDHPFFAHSRFPL